MARPLRLSSVLLAVAFCALSTPKVLWERDMGTITQDAVAAPDGSVVGRGGKGIVCIDGHTGKTRWEMDTRANDGAPAIGPDGYVYVAIQDVIDRQFRLHKLDGRTGSIQWKVVTAPAAFNRPIVTGSTCFVFETNLAAFATSDGSPLWSLGESEGFPEGILVGDRLAFASGGQIGVRVLDMNGGQELWRHQGASGPLASDGKILIANSERLDLRTGRTLWKTQFPLPAVRVGVGKDGDVYCSGPSSDQAERWVARLDRESGAQKWVAWLPEGSENGWWATPVESPQGLLFVPTNKDLLALNAENGKIVWTHPLPDEFSNSPVMLEDGTVVVFSGTKALAVR